MKNPFIAILVALFAFSTAIGQTCEESLTTTFAAGNGSSGNMFNVTAINTITIHTLDGHFVPNYSGDVEIYYKQGSYVGFEATPSAWTLAGSATVNSMGYHTPTPVPINLNLTITAGKTYAFYFTASDNQHPYVRYTVSGTPIQDANLSMTPGTGNGYPFISQFYYPRTWNGVINYTVTCGGCPNPCNAQGACNYGACEPCIMPDGCTNVTACNYNQNAQCDDGSCDFSCFECTTPSDCDDGNPCTTDNCFNGTCSYTQIPDCGLPWIVTPTIDNHTLLLNPALMSNSIGGVPLATGDYIAVFFDNNGLLIPGGMEMWDGSIKSLSIWGDDNQTTQKDGFLTGESFVFKVWQAATNTIFDVNVTFVPANSIPGISHEGIFAVNGISALSSVQSVESSDCAIQEIPIKTGWSMISSNIIPDEPDMDSIIQHVKSNIIIIKDAYGNAVFPSFGLNQIGDWDVLKGYTVKSLQETTLSIGCQRVDPSTPIPLSNGWSMISSLRNAPVDVSSALQSINDNLVIAKNIDGDAYFPLFGLNSIGNLMPGEGYKVLMSGADTLVYSANKISSQIDYQKPAAPNYYKYDHKTGNNATVIVPKSALGDNLKPGDEIGIFNEEGRLAGSAVIQNSNIAITVWGDDQVTEDVVEGMFTGDRFNYRLWDHTIGIERALSVTYQQGLDQYMVDGISILKKINLADELINSDVKLHCYPNPTSGELTFAFNLPKGAEVSATIYDMLGKEINQVNPGYLTTGQHKIVYNVSQLPSGRYIYRLFIGDKQLNGNFVKSY